MRSRRTLVAVLATVATALVWITVSPGGSPTTRSVTSGPAASTGDADGLAHHERRPGEAGASETSREGGRNEHVGADALPSGSTVRTVDVLVRDDQRKPFAGLTVVATSPDAAIEIVGLTDALGRASLAISWKAGGRVFLRRAGREVDERRIDDVLAASGPLLLFGDRREQASLRVRLRGRAFLPKTFAATIAGAPLRVAMTVPDDGFIRGDYALPIDPAPMSLEFRAEGFAPVVVEIPEDPYRSGVDLFVELEPAGPALSIEERAPRDLVSTFFLIERWDPMPGAWAYAQSTAPGAMKFADGVARVTVKGLTAGRYRVVEGIANARSESFDLAAGGAPASARFDFPNAGMARGRIAVPPALAGASLMIGVWDGTRAEGSPRSTAGVGGPEFSFAVPVPGDRPVTLGAIHALGPAYGEPGTETVVAPRDGIELRVVESTATTRIEMEAPGRDEERPGTASVRIWDPGARRVVWEHRVTLAAGGYRFGGYRPGVYDVVIDDQLHAPLLFVNIELRTGETSLGRHTLGYGASIRLHQIVPDGVDAPRTVMAFAERLDDPRVGNTQRTSVGERIRGMIPGRYRVTFFANGPLLPPASGVSQIVEVVEGGEADATIEFKRGQTDSAPK